VSAALKGSAQGGESSRTRRRRREADAARSRLIVPE
jgi:hypothetical protein